MPPRKSRPTPAKPKDRARQILETALAMANEDGWGNLRLRKLAEASGLSMAELCRHYRDQDAIANAWFGQALDAMLGPVPRDFSKRPATERLSFLLRRWFDALTPNRRVTTEMLGAKLWYAHPHHYAPMAFDLSRLIQRWRDAAGLDAAGRQRQIEEIGLTLLFLDALRCWCGDESDGQAATRVLIERRLALAGRLARSLFD